MTTIHDTAIVDPSASIGENVEIGPFCTVGPNARIGDGTVLRSHVVIDRNTVIGQGCVVHPFAVLGGAPQHTGYKDEDTRLEIGDNCVIRESVTMNRGMPNAANVTRVGSNGYFMAYSHVGHDCIVGDNVIFANSATLGGPLPDRRWRHHWRSLRDPPELPRRHRRLPCRGGDRGQ